MTDHRQSRSYYDGLLHGAVGLLCVLVAMIAASRWFGCIYKPTINVLPIQPGRSGTTPVRAVSATQPASAPAYRPQWSPDELYEGDRP